MARVFARPGVTVAGAAFAALMTGIVANAVMFQRARHPSPLFTAPAPDGPALTKPVMPTPPATRAAVADPAPPPEPAPARSSAEPLPAAASAAPAKPKPKPHPVAVPRKPAAHGGDAIGQLLQAGPHGRSEAKPARPPAHPAPKPAKAATGAEEQ